MRAFLVSLLLVLSLPGLVLPAGVAWHVCRCASTTERLGEPLDEPTAANCCAAHEPASDEAVSSSASAAARSSCCRHGAPAPSDDGSPADGGDDVARGVCGCTWVEFGEDRPEPAPPTHTPAPAPVLPAEPAALHPFALAPPRAAIRAAPSFHHRPPPPDSHRNLPLRL